MNLSMRILAAFVVSILSCRKAMSFLDVPSRSLLVSEEATAESISVQSKREKMNKVEAFDPLKSPRNRKSANRLSGQRKQKRRRKLYWVSNNAGLFSHFFQVKYMSAIASNWNRDLVIVPYKSIHADKEERKAVNLCSILNFTSGGEHPISCSALMRNSTKNCFIRFQALNRFDKMPNLCYSGKVWGKSGIVPLRQKLEVMMLSPRLEFTNTYRRLFASVVQQLLSVEGSESKNSSVILSRMPTYCVVHWRRGDQLTSRCASDWQGLRDSSVNCGTVDDLIDDINSFFSPPCKRKRPRLIFIATNEKNETILDHLRLRGFTPLGDVTTAYSFPGQTSLDEFIVETQFMLQADIFLSYGISQVNDVIEYERMMSGRGWCERDASVCASATGTGTTIHNSWCQVSRNNGSVS